MLILLINLFAMAMATPTEPMEIVVSDTVEEEIYFEEPVVLCDEPCHFENDTSAVFVQANSKHRSWLKDKKVGAVYNNETVKINYPDCNFQTNTFKCANETGMWVMRTKITIDKDIASINILLFDENGVVIGQANRVSTKKRTIVEKEKVTEQIIPTTPTLPTTITNCDPKVGGCATVPMPAQPIITKETEDLEPEIIKTRPILSNRDIQQAMIFLYSSVI